MSLDFDLVHIGEVTDFSANITHNLADMADALGVYQMLWHPEEILGLHAKEMIPALDQAIQELEINPNKYIQYEASNGWGTIKNFLPWLKKVRDACLEYPESMPRADV
jgi:hypothetical protein